MQTAHPNIDVFETFYDSFSHGDMEKLATLIAPDIVWHIPGDNLLSGTYTSTAEIFGCFDKIFQLSEGTFKPEPIDILADDNYTIALMHGNARRGAKVLDQRYALIVRIRDGQIIEWSEAWTEGPAWNEFWS